MIYSLLATTYISFNLPLFLLAGFSCLAVAFMAAKLAQKEKELKEIQKKVAALKVSIDDTNKAFTKYVDTLSKNDTDAIQNLRRQLDEAIDARIAAEAESQQYWEMWWLGLSEEQRAAETAAMRLHEEQQESNS